MNVMMVAGRWCPKEHGKVIITLTRSYASSSSSSVDSTRDWVQIVNPSAKSETFPDPQALSSKRGTGGRSSFNGIVATVFGASGMLGGYVVNKLGKTGSQVILPYRGDPRLIMPLKLCGDLGQILFLPFYLRDEESIKRAVKYSNVVVNCIGKDSDTASFTLDEVHVEGSRLIAKACREAGVKRLIHVSALGASPNPKPQTIFCPKGSEFMRTKYLAEQAVREEFPEAIIFRPSDMFGEDDRFINYYSHWWRRSYRKILVYNKGRGVYKMPVHVSDVATGIYNAIMDNTIVGQTIDAYGPKKYEVKDIVNFISQAIQKDEFHYWKGTKDMRFNPSFWVRTFVTQTLKKYPVMSFERIEREMITDMPSSDLNLSDLGISPFVQWEDKAYYYCFRYRRFGYYDEELGEKPKPDLMKVYPTNHYSLASSI